MLDLLQKYTLFLQFISLATLKHCVINSFAAYGKLNGFRLLFFDCYFLDFAPFTIYFFLPV